MPIPRTLSAALLTVLAVALTGCTATPAAAPPQADPLATVPDDLILDLRVLTPQSRLGSDEQPIVQPGRFVLLPDGSLHAQLDGLHRARAVPPFVRRLDARQLAETWALINELGYADPQQADPMMNPLQIDYPQDGALYVLSIRGRQQQWMFRRRVVDPQRETAMQRLTDRLTELAWLDVQQEGTRMIAPRRYDFGPDPYARYRSGGHGSGGDGP